MAIESFRRKEHKYLISTEQYRKLVQQLTPYMHTDKHGVDGKYTVTTLYFESPDLKIYYETKNRQRIRQKLRLRIYDKTDIHHIAFFEIKQKHEELVNKKRIRLTLKEAYRYLKQSSHDSLEGFDTSNIQTLKEIDHFRNLYHLKPAMIISYDRHALSSANDGLRVTFDLNLRCRNDDLSIENGSYGKRVIDNHLVVLEVKVNDSIPPWLTRILEDLNCKQRSISKYCASIELLKNKELGNETGKEDIFL